MSYLDTALSLLSDSRTLRLIDRMAFWFRTLTRAGVRRVLSELPPAGGTILDMCVRSTGFLITCAQKGGGLIAISIGDRAFVLTSELQDKIDGLSLGEVLSTIELLDRLGYLLKVRSIEEKVVREGAVDVVSHYLPTSRAKRLYRFK